MRTVTVYSSAPVSTKLAVAFYNLSCQGVRVVLKPLAELPTGPQPPRRRCLLREDLERVTLRLAAIGDELSDHESGKCRLEAGYELGLRAERDALQSRQRGLRASVAAQKGGQDNG